MRRIDPVAALLLLALGSCQDSDILQEREANQPRPVVYHLTEEFRVGLEAGAELFGGIGSVALTRSGNVIVEDPQALMYSVFSSNGELVATVGSRGKAPGEFEDMSGLVVGPGDSVYVFDGSSRRLSVFDPSHRFDYSTVVEQGPGGGRGLARLFSFSIPTKLIGVIGAGYIIQYESLLLPLADLIDLTSDTESSAFLVNRLGETARKPIARLPGRELIHTTSGQETVVLERPFGRSFLFRTNADGFLYSGWNESIDIEKRDANGRLHGRINRRHSPVYVTLEDIAITMEKMSLTAKRLVRESDLPETMPAFETFIVDDHGRVWLQQDLSRIESDSVATWSILNPQGQIIAETQLPASVTLQVVRSGRAYGNGRDSTGAPFVVAYRISN